MKKLQASELRVGMFVDHLEGSWIGHGLWRTRFMISDARMLESARHSGAHGFWIDVDRCVLVGDRQAADPEPPVPVPVAELPASLLEAEPTQAASFAEETARAAKVCAAARAAVVAMFEDVRYACSPDIAAAQPVVQSIIESVTRNSHALVSLARLKLKDDYTYMHSVSVCALMVALGRELQLEDAMCRRLGIGGLLHDIGKARIPLEILNKPGKLSDEEFRIVRAHSAEGHDIAVKAGLTDDVALDVVLHHHEKLDGSGYPDRLAGKQVPFAARAGAVCDVYDAVTPARPYKEAWDPADALRQMASWQGHFDRDVLAALIRTIGVFPTGSLVRLASGRLAVVIENRREAPRAPVVRVFYSTNSQMRIAHDVIDLSRPGTREKIVAREPRDDWNAAHLDSLSAPHPP